MRVVLVLILFSWGLSLSAHQPSYRQYTAEDGLPSSQIFDLQQDLRGYLWMATDHGASRYDGYTFTNYTSQNGLGDNTVLELYLDSTGNLWAATYSGGLFFFREGSFFPHPQNDAIKKLTPNNWLEDIQERNGRLVASVANRQQEIIIYEDSVRLQNKTWNEDPPYEMITPGWFSKYNIPGKGYDSYLIGTDKWIAYTNGYGAWRLFDDGTATNFLPNASVTDIFRDLYGNYWFSTLHDGLFFLPNINISTFGRLEGIQDIKITALEVGNDRLYISSYNGDIYQMTAALQFERVNYGKSKYINYDLIYFNDRLLNTSSFYTKNKAFHPNITRVIAPSVFGYWVGGKHDVKLYEATGNEFQSINHEGFKRVYSLYEDKSGSLWIGTANGLFVWKEGKLNHYANRDNRLSVRISDIDQLASGHIILATRGEGILVMNEDTIYQIDQDEGMASNLINKVYVNGNEVWVGSNKGLTELVIDENGKLVNLFKLDVDDGLPSNEVNDMIMYRGDLYLATNKGIARIILENLEYEAIGPRVEIRSINEVLLPQPPPFTHIFPWDESTIEIGFSGIDFRNAEAIRYEYRLIGQDTNWVETPNRSVRFEDLKGGGYEFQVRAFGRHGHRGVYVSSIKFKVGIHFTATIWFRTLIILLVIVLLGGLGYWYFRNRELKIQRQRKLMVSEQKALRSQMNPHFIFNAMNSIHYFITENDKKNASIFLSKFSALIRQVLENSKKNLVTVEEELKSLETYLELEQLRFGDKFHFHIEVDPSITQSELRLPTMIIQPHLENAIWHGLTPLEDGGDLWFRLKLQGDSLRAEIEDNGIGREAAADISTKRKGHQSTGMRNIEERIELFNRQYRTKIKVKVVDKKDDSGKATGTLVKIDFPYKDFDS